jgi:lysophospholipase L1-like esterase
MNRHNGISDNNKKDRTKATAAAIPMVGAIVTAALLLSGLSLIGSYQPATAQQNMTGGGGATTGGGTAGGNATTAGGNATTGVNQTTLEVRSHLEEARTALEAGDTETALLHLDLALNTLGGNMTTTAGVVGEEVVIEEGEEGEGGEEGEEGEGGEEGEEGEGGG